MAAVKEVLALGSQEWIKVQEIHNIYAIQNDRICRVSNPLKTKFKNMVDQKKPTGETACPPWIREAKSVKISHKVVVDQDSNSNEAK